MDTNFNKITELINQSENVLIIQADNPDSDSLGSALILESVLEEMGKQVSLYCGIEIPSYIKYFNGWDLINKYLPNRFDLTIFVDVSTTSLFEKLDDKDFSKIKKSPSIIFDHHVSSNDPIDFATVSIIDNKRSSTGELIYKVGKNLSWNFTLDEMKLIAMTILGDTQGLSNQLATSETYNVMAELIDKGVNRPELEELRRKFNKMPVEIFKYKSELINKTKFSYENRIAYNVIPQSEINKYSPLYNPSALIQPDILQTENVDVGIVFKTYDDNKITASIRCNPNAGIANSLAKEFGGGGHDYASGFKVYNKDMDTFIPEVIKKAIQLLNI
jgi:phosphoesterase RecJ-like protein